MKPDEDAYGRALLDLVTVGQASEIIERDDGLIEHVGGPDFHLAPFRRWSAVERRGIRWVRGRVLDAGAGAGRVTLHLQAKGFDVVAIDISRLAVQAARHRGVRRAHVVRIEDVDNSLGLFDTIVMYGNNLALLGSPAKAQRMLRRLHRVTTPRARIIGSNVDPHVTDNEDHLAYHRRNHARGRMTGQVRIRVRYRRSRTQWIDLLFLSPDELRALLPGTGWRLERLIEDVGPAYVAVLEKDSRARDHLPAFVTT